MLRRIKFICTLLVILISVANTQAQSIGDAWKAYYNEQPDKAKDILKNLVAKSPTDAELNFRTGVAYYMLGKKDSATFYFNQGMKVEEKYNYCLAGVGLLALDEKNTAKAQESFNKLINNNKSKDVKAYIFVSQAYYYSTAKDADNAITNLKKALELDPKNVEAYLTLAPIYLSKGDGGKAVTNYENAIEKDATLAYPWMKIGQIYMMSRNYEEALKHFKKSNELDANYIPVYRELAEFNYYLKKYDESVKNYKKYIDMAGPTIERQSRYASFLFLNKDYPGAITIIEDIVKRDSSNAILSRLIGYSYYEQGKYQDALTYMQKFFTKADPAKIIGSDYAYLGKAYAKVPGNDSIAVVNLNKAISLDSTNTDLYGDLAVTLMTQKKFVEAAAIYQRKLDMSRPNSTDYFLMGKAYYYAKDFAHADSSFGKVNELQPTAATGYLWRARTNAQLDPESDKGLALPYYQKYVELATDETKFKKELVESYSYIGYLSFLKKDNAAAKTAWQKVKDLDPENEKAAEFFKSLK